MEILKTIPYSEFYMWDVKRYNYVFNNSFENAVFLRDILTPFKQSVSKEELIKNQWNIIKKINFQGELFLRDISEINSYKGNVNKVPENSIIYSKINVRHGCVYYHEKGQAPFAVSSEYPTFTFDKKRVNGYYLKRVLRSNEFKKLLNTKTSGISKARVKVDEFLDIQIPLPPLTEQNRIVSNYNAKIKQANEQEQKAKELEQEIEKYLFDVLGIEKLEEKENKKGIYLFNFSNIDRWDIWTNKSEIESSKYKNTKLGFVVKGKPQYGANVKGVNQKSETRYIRITDINEAGYLNDKFVSPASVNEKYLLQEGDFLIARSGNTVGKTLLFKGEYGRAIYAGYLVRYKIDYSVINPDYLFLFTKSYIFKKWIESNQRISGQPNINGQEFLQAPLVIPPLKIQNKIANHISKLKQQIKNLQTQAKENREMAIQEFEDAIFAKS